MRFGLGKCRAGGPEAMQGEMTQCGFEGIGFRASIAIVVGRTIRAARAEHTRSEEWLRQPDLRKAYRHGLEVPQFVETGV